MGFHISRMHIKALERCVIIISQMGNSQQKTGKTFAVFDEKLHLLSFATF
jgi:hypothetical protein